MEAVNAAALLVEELRRHGVERVFGVPGEETLDLVEAMRRAGLPLVVTRSEQAAGFMAATVGRLTGRAGVALATLGPGATNFVTAAAYAQLGGFPAVLVTGQKPLRSGMQGRFQTIDVVSALRPVTKHAETLSAASDVPGRVRDALRIAEAERPGAVLLELPDDVAREEAALDLAPDIGTPAELRRVPERLIREAAALLTGASYPVLLVGEGASRGDAIARALRRLVAHAELPFATTPMAKGVLDEDDPRWLGTTAVSSGDAVHAALARADLVLVVGHDTTEKPPFFPASVRAAVVHVGATEPALSSVYAPDLVLAGDVEDALERLAGAVPARLGARAHAAFAAARAQLEAHLARETSDARFPIHPPRLVAEVRGALPDDAVVCLDNGMYKLWFARAYRARLPRTLLLDNALATMGAGLPSAIAAKLVLPERKVVAVVGDGGLMMSVQELETAVRLGIDLTVLVVRDDGYGMIRWKQAELALPDHGMTFGNPDMVRLAEAFGAKGHALRDAADLGPLLARTTASRGVHLVDVPIDYEANHRILGEELRALGRACLEPVTTATERTP